MRVIRIFFSKTGEAAYISHLDLQRVMARALRRSGIPVWYSQGFNPHIYMSFALPLPLMQESMAEAMDCKTESKLDDFSGFLAPLNQALPRGIEAFRIEEPLCPATDISFAEYRIEYAMERLRLRNALLAFNSMPEAVVVRKTKRSEKEMNLKELAPSLEVDAETASFAVRLPAGGEFNINPELLTGFLQKEFDLPRAHILRTQVLTKDLEPFS